RGGGLTRIFGSDQSRQSPAVEVDDFFVFFELHPGRGGRDRHGEIERADEDQSRQKAAALHAGAGAAVGRETRGPPRIISASPAARNAISAAVTNALE